MRLTCPKCKAAIAKADVALEQGIARCVACDEYFRLATHLRTDEEIRRSQKPLYSQVRIDQGEQQSSVWIPARGWNMGLWFPALFMCAAIGVSLFAMLQEQNIPYFMSFVFIAASLAMALPSFVQIRVMVDRTISVTWRFLGLTRTRRAKTRDLMKVTESVVYNRNYQPVYGIAFLLKDGSKLTFGSALKEEERKWLIGELQEIIKRDQFRR